MGGELLHHQQSSLL